MAEKNVRGTRIAIVAFLALALAAIIGPVLLAGRYDADPSTLCAEQGDKYDPIENACVDG